MLFLDVFAKSNHADFFHCSAKIANLGISETMKSAIRFPEKHIVWSVSRLVLFFCVMLKAMPVHGQSYSFNRINVKDGLSQSSVLDIAKDELGLMWFATRYGLNRYDGVRFKVYEHDPGDSNSICNNYINRIFRDSKDDIWVGTTAGLDRYDRVQDRFVHFPFYRKRQRLSMVSVMAIAEDIAGNLWVGTDKGLFVRRPEAASCQSMDNGAGPITDQSITEVFADSRGLLWVAATQGIGLFRIIDHRLIRQQLPFDPAGVRGGIRSIAEDQDKQIWLGSETDGLYCLQVKSQALMHFPSSYQGLIHNSIRKIVVSQSQRLVIGTQNGVSVLDPQTLTFVNYQHDPDNPNTISQNSIYSLYEDEQGSLWVGTYFGGINMAYGIDTKFNRLTTGTSPVAIPHNVIKQFAEDSIGNLWLSTEGGGVFRLDSSLRQVAHFYNPSGGLLGARSNFVKSIHIDRSGEVWAGSSGGGLYRLDPRTGDFQRLSLGMDTLQERRVNILNIYQDANQHYWVCGEGYNGVFSRSGNRLLDVTPQNVRTALNGQGVFDISEASDQSLWILTASSLVNYDVTSGRLSEHSTGTETTSRPFNCLLEDHSGLVWIGIDHGGLLVIDPKKDLVVRHYTAKDGLASDNVVGLVEDKHHNLWITTTNGLSKLTKGRNTIQNYSRFDGIANDEFNYTATFLTADGKVMLGSLGGLTWFYPEDIEVNTDTPSLIFTGLTLFGREPVGPQTHRKILSKNITQAPHLTFADSQSIFTIQFSLDNYIKSAQNRFAYRLEGRNPAWTYIDKGEINFSNLSPGWYTLSVKGANSDGIWSDERTLTFTIRPPFYWTWWAIVVYTALIALFIFFIVRYFYLKRVLEKEEELNQHKLNFFSIISHEIRTHLSLIIIPIENSLEKVGDTYVVKQLKDAAKNSERLLRLTAELIDFRKAETANLTLRRQNMDIKAFIEEIYSAFKNVYESKDVAFVYESAFASHTVAVDPIQLEKVLFNLLSNAVKHSSPHGIIRMNSSLTQGVVQITVSNHGKEIPKEYLKKIFENYFQISGKDRELGFGVGLALSKQVMELHGGDIRAHSENGVTAFTITLPSVLVEEREKVEVQQEYFLDAYSAATDELLYYADGDHRPTVLLVEDNPELMALLEALLTEHYDLLKSKNGKEGVELALEHLPDLIISDVMMPLKSGTEVCRELKGNIATCHIPIILLTAMNAESDFVTGLHYNADVYLTKPFNRRILLLHVRNLLRSNRIMQDKYRQQYVLGPTQQVVDTADEKFLAKAVATIEAGIELSQYSVDFIGEGVGMSQSVLYKKVKSLTGMTVNDFSKHIRLKKAAQLLRETNYTVSQIASYVGFTDSKYFSREFKRQFGANPSQYTEENA